MVHAARLLGLVSACAALLVASTLVAEPASAQGDACKADLVSAAGRAKLRLFTKNQKKELEGDGAAMRDAIAKWELKVKDSFGDEWKKWSAAKDTTFDCESTKGKILGAYIGCTISGRPCMTAPRAGEAVVEDEKGPGARPRKGGAPIVTKRGPIARPNPDPAARYEDWVYEREMARQRRMEEERKRAETLAYEREMARQKYLAEKRARDETLQWERENARQRYLVEERKRGDRYYDRRYWSDGYDD